MGGPTTQADPSPSAFVDAASSEEDGRELSKEEINSLPLRAYHGPVRVVDSDSEISPALRVLRSKVLGFDIEARPCFRRGETHPPALLQLCGADCVVLFRLQALTLPNALWRLLEDPSVFKVGVGLARDVKDLQTIHPFSPEGFLDLTTISAPLGMKAAGLRSLAANLLGFRIGKGAQTSNWEAPALSSGQIAYAATDAWVGRELYLVLDAMRRQAELSAPKPISLGGI